MDAAPPGPQPTQKRRVGLVILIVVLALILCASASYVLIPQVKERVSLAVAALQVPSDLRSALFIGMQDQKSVYYTPTWYGFSVDPAPLLETGPGRSPDGSRHVYVETFANGAGTNGVLGAGSIDPNAWLVFMRSEEGAPELIARGYAPAFLDDTHLAYFSQRGLVVRDLASNASTLLFVFPTTTRISQVQYSPNRSLVTWTDASTGEMVVASIDVDTYRPIHLFNDLVSPVLTDTSVYDIRLRPKGRELWRHALDGSESVSVLRIPESLGLVLIQSNL